MFPRIPLRLMAAASVFLIALVSMAAGVGFSERDFSAAGGVLEYGYYSLSLFVIGGVDLGTPIGGPAWARAGLWIAYFAAPILTVSAVLDAIFSIFSMEKFRLKRARNHVIIGGHEFLVEVVLRRLREFDEKAMVVVVVDNQTSPNQIGQWRKRYGALIVATDVTDEYILDKLRVDYASKALILGEETLSGFESAYRILQRNPALAGSVSVHCSQLRFMRSMQRAASAHSINTFNTYQLAASKLVETEIGPALDQGSGNASVVIAGFGRFGQSILELLQDRLADKIDSVAVLSDDAERRLMVTKEQVDLTGDFTLHTFQGDMSHPKVWTALDASVSLNTPNIVFVLATARGPDNLRTALWLRRRNSHAMIIARTEMATPFATQVGLMDNVTVVSVDELAGYAIPREWLLPAEGGRRSAASEGH